MTDKERSDKYWNRIVLLEIRIKLLEDTKKTLQGKNRMLETELELERNYSWSLLNE